MIIQLYSDTDAEVSFSLVQLSERKAAIALFYD